MLGAVLLWAAAAACLFLIDDGGRGYLVGYIVLQAASILAAIRARKSRTD